MLTAMRAVENLCDGAGHDIWAVNADSVYHERAEPDEQPYRVAPETPAMARRRSVEESALRQGSWVARQAPTRCQGAAGQRLG